MATSPIFTVIRNMLNNEVESLRTDLRVLERQMAYEKSGMFISHNNEDTLLVYAAAKFKAYIPKRYNSWEVRFIEWNGEELPIDMDEDIFFD